MLNVYRKYGSVTEQGREIMYMELPYSKEWKCESEANFHQLTKYDSHYLNGLSSATALTIDL